MADDDKEKSEYQPPTILIWAARGISLLLVLGLLGYFTYQAIGDEKPAAFEFDIRTDEAEQRGKRWLLPVNVYNSGDQSVQQLIVNVLGDDKPMKPPRNISLRTIGPAERLQTVIWMDEDPRQVKISCEVDSYLLP